MPNNVSKRKINFLDFLLLVLIIATVSAAIVSVIRSNPNKISGGDTEIIYKIKCEMVNEAAAANIRLGDKIYDNESNQLLGEVIAEPQKIPVNYINDAGDDTPTGKVTLTIEIKAQVWKDGGIYSIDNYSIAEGKEVVFHSEYFSFSGLCTSLAER